MNGIKVNTLDEYNSYIYNNLIVTFYVQIETQRSFLGKEKNVSQLKLMT